jgi:hypothetical protein
MKNTTHHCVYMLYFLCNYVQCIRKVAVHLYKVLKSIEITIVSKNRIKQLHTFPELHFNRCLTTEYSETTAHFKGNFDTDNQIYVP